MVSTYNLVFKFLTAQGARVLRGHQATGRSCYVTSLYKDAVSETLAIEDLREEKDWMSPVEELTQIILNPEHSDRLVSIGSLLEPGLQGKLIQFCRII